MKVGVLSDTHDILSCVEDAAGFFRAEGVELVIHLGDLCRPELLAPLCRNGSALVGVFGNNDFERAAIAAGSGGGFAPGPRVVEAGGRRLLMAHDFRSLESELGGGRFDLVLFGHTHRPLTMRIGKAQVLNPGEGCGLLTGRRTCAVVDLATMAVRLADIPAHGGGCGSP